MMLIIYILTIPSLSITAQENKVPWENLFNELSEIEDMENKSWEDTYDILCDLYNNKININTATREDLERIIFLTQKQIEEISEYIYKYGPIRTIGELSMIESLDYTRRNLMSYFIYIENDADKKKYPSLKDILKYGKNELIAAGKIPLYEREGDKKGYIGYKYKHWFRYTYKYGQYFQAGITGSQDAGEPFFARGNTLGYDYYSLYFLIRKLGRLKTLAAGRYRLKFGMGLILNNDFSFGKIATLTNPNINNSIRAHSSKSEANYLQGVAATFNICNRLDATAFASYRKIDATPGKEKNTITTIITSGYHRTENEILHKHNVSQTVAGANLRFYKNGFHIGATAVHTSIDKELRPDITQEFRRHYMSGKTFTNISTDYGYNSHRLTVNGETAIDNKTSIATINQIAYRPNSLLTITLLQRFYSYKFNAFFGRCFNDGGRIQNESGIYLGGNWNPSPNFKFMAYSDYAYFAWPKYSVSKASYSWDNFVSATWIIDNFSISTRYRLRMRQRDNKEKSQQLSLNEHRARLVTSYNNNKWTFSIQTDASIYKHEENNFGCMFASNINYKNKWITAYASLAYFNTDNYESRLYTYERGLLHNFSFPMLYGNGIRYSTNIRTDISQNLMLILKLGTTKYFDRNKISSSLQQINKSSMTDIETQIKWKF